MDEKKTSRRGFLKCGSLGLLSLGFLGGAGYMGYLGLQPPEEIDAPLPDREYEDVEVSQKGPQGDELTNIDSADMCDDDKAWDKIDACAGGPVKSTHRDDMAKMSIFIPAIGSYSKIRASDHFGQSRYGDFYSISVPENPRRSVWYSAGAPLVGGDEGTTLIAGHVAHNGRWGAFKKLYRVRPGNVMYTKDAEGQVQKWKVTKLYYLNHRKFPQEYWEKTGPRQLVIATCGGKSKRGFYRQNIFSVAVPV